FLHSLEEGDVAERVWVGDCHGLGADDLPSLHNFPHLPVGTTKAEFSSDSELIHVSHPLQGRLLRLHTSARRMRRPELCRGSDSCRAAGSLLLRWRAACASPSHCAQSTQASHTTTPIFRFASEPSASSPSSSSSPSQPRRAHQASARL